MKRRNFIQCCAGAGLLALPAVRNPFAMSGKDSPASQRTGIVLDDLFLEHVLEPGHPESPRRLEMIMQYLAGAGVTADLQQLAAVDAVEPQLLTVHTREHIDSIRNNYPDTFPVAMAVVGAALSAVDAVCLNSTRNVFCATRPPGHHAMNTGREEGFCFFNAIAVAANYARQKYHMQRVLVVDWDYHHGNGTEAAFYNDPEVLFFSTHDRYAYPGTGDPARTGAGAGKGFNINVHLDCGATDDVILAAFRNRLLPVVADFKPEIILVSAGFDSREEDLLGCFEVTDSGFVTLTQMMMQLADKYCGGRLVSILEGGYNIRGNASAVLHHVRTLSGL